MDYSNRLNSSPAGLTEREATSGTQISDKITTGKKTLMSHETRKSERERYYNL